MPEVNILAVPVAAVTAFILSGAYYAMVGDRLAQASETAAAGDPMTPLKVGAELLRCLVVAGVTAGLASRTGTDDWGGGLLLGLVLWIGFPLVLWTGAMLHERANWRLAAIHGGDWLIKLLAVSLVVSAWQ